MRKVWFPTTLVVLLAIITIAYIRLVLLMSENRPVYDALPETTSIVFEFNHPEEALERLSASAFHPYLQEAAFFKKLITQLSAIDSLMKTGAADTSFKTWHDSKLLASMSITGRNEFDYLYLLRKTRFTKDKFQKFITEVETKFSVSKRLFRDETVYEIPIGETGKPLACTFVNGMFLASYSPRMVDDAVTQLRDKQSILESDGFSEVQELAGEDADVVLYLNLQRLHEYAPILVNEEETDFFETVSSAGNWMELDIKVKDNAFMINGYTSTDGEKKFFAGFNREPATQIEIIRALPYNTSLFFYYAVGEFDIYLKDKGKTFGPEMDNFQNWISNEWCFGLLEPLDKDYENDGFLLVRAIEPEVAIQSLAERARLSGADLNLEEFKQYPIGQLSLKDDLNHLFDHHFIKISYPYYTVIDDFVVFANDISVIKTVLQHYEEGQTLRTDPDYMVFERNLTTTSNFYIYFNTARSTELLNRLLSNALVSDIRKGERGFLKFSPMALQFSRYQDIFFTNGCIQFSSQVEERSNRFWQVKLDATPAGSPAFVTNHYTGEKEILIQDEQNNLYLITKNGRILWKRQLDAPIMSEIYQIDFFENTKIQFAFNTKNKIYIIDRKGENVASYPVQLPAEASNGMLLVDYDRNKDYRVFVACANGNIYGYYKSGKPLPGWNPRSKIGTIKFPIKHINVDGKDFLVAQNENGEIFLFNRKGELRSKPVKTGKPFSTEFRTRIATNNFQLVNADKDGNIYKVYRNGSFSSQKQENIPKNFFDFFYTDLNNDGSYEMVFVDSLVVKVYDEKFAEIASPYFPEKISKAFIVNDGTARGMGFLSLTGKIVYYAGSDYNLNPSFPLASCTPFITEDLFETGRKVVIAGNCDGWVNAYQIK